MTSPAASLNFTQCRILPRHQMTEEVTFKKQQGDGFVRAAYRNI
jgi:hypothetical protein